MLIKIYLYVKNTLSRFIPFDFLKIKVISSHSRKDPFPINSPKLINVTNTLFVLLVLKYLIDKMH
jgi:hypothetical protein